MGHSRQVGWFVSTGRLYPLGVGFAIVRSPGPGSRPAPQNQFCCQSRRCFRYAVAAIFGKMSGSHVTWQIPGRRMDIAAEFLSATINAFEANKRLGGSSRRASAGRQTPRRTRREHELHRRHHEARRREPDFPLDRLPDDGRREAVAQPGRRVRGLVRQPGGTPGVVGARLGLPAEDAQEPEARKTSKRPC